MARFRLLLAWLVLAALPLQGFAAASMLFCGMEQAGHAHAAGPVRGAVAHDHAAHSHATANHAVSDVHSGDAGKAGQDQQAHACATCMSCCHVVAIGVFEPLQQATAAPGAEPSSPLVRIATRATSVPDKPPRA